MKLSIVASTAAVLALTSLPFGQATTPSLRSAMGEEKQELEVVLKTSDKFIDASGTFLAEDDLTKASKVITPIYESTSTFYGGSESDAVENLDVSVGSSRAGYYKFRIADFMSKKASAIDIADFDNAWHEAFNMIHGTRDGIYFAGESIFKIEDETDETDEANETEDGMLQRTWTWKDWYVYMQYRCRWCPDDDSAEDTLLTLGKKDPVFNNKSMNAVAQKACEIMVNLGNEHFTSVHDCTAVVTSPPDFAKLFDDDNNVKDEILSASA